MEWERIPRTNSIFFFFFLIQADLQSKETHSTQTILSHLRRENSSQTWLPGTVASQTKRDGKSNVPRPHVYLAGLRGQRDGRVEKIILTRPVDE